MYVAAKGNAVPEPRLAGDRPQRPAELQELHRAGPVKQIPTLAKQPDKTIKSDCKQLFTSLVRPGHGLPDPRLLVPGRRPQARHQGHRRRRSRQAFQTAKKQQFPTATAFQTFLTQSGQTMQDILFRVRVNEIYKKLLARHQTTVTQRADPDLLQRPITSQFGTPETRDIRIVRTNTAAARERREGRARRAARAGTPSPRSTRSTPRPRTRADCSTASPRARRSRRSTPPASAPR